MASTLLYLSSLLLPLASVYAQTTSEHALALNSLSSFSGSSSPTLFSLPSSDSLSVSVALCASTNSLPQFYVANDTTDATEIVLWQGFGNWTGPAPSGGMFKVENIGSNSFEIGISNDGPTHRLLDDTMWFGDSTSNQALLFSPIFAQAAETLAPSYPNYTFPAANLSLPDAPTDAPSYTILIAPTSENLASLPQTACAIRNASGQVGNIVSQDMWLKGSDDGWRSQWLIDGLTPSTNYTTYIIQDNTIITSAAYFVTKSAQFSCPLVHSLPYCPSVSYAVPLPEPIFPYSTYNATNVPSGPSSLLLEYLTNFTTVLGTFACGRDVYSPVQTCAACQTAYRKWLCSISFTRCGEQTPSTTPVISQNTGQQVFSALGPMVTSSADNRNPNLTDANISYTPLLPCLETCNAADRACPNFLGFACPIPKYNANMSYGVGYIDSGVLGVLGQGSTGAWQDRWGNVWCNGS